MKVALVHDYLVERGGAEKVLATLHQMFPNAPIFTSVYNPRTTLHLFRGARVRTSFLQRLTAHPHRYRALLPLYPLAFRSFALDEFDLVMSSASGFAKNVRKGRGAHHICYCYTPPRFVWGYQEANGRERFHPLARLGLSALLPYLRRADQQGAGTVDRWLTSSRCVAARIAVAYGREATVVPPPIDCQAFLPSERPGDFFLILSRLVPYKRIELAVGAFNRCGRPLLIVGDGRDRRRLEALAHSPRISFLGHRPQAEVRRLLSTCRALIVTAEEDFGMTPLEANASGRPVIVYGAGGAHDTVVPGVTGVTFSEQRVEALLDALEEFEHLSFDPETLVRHARRFDTSEFRRAIRRVIAAEVGIELEEQPEGADPQAGPSRESR